MGATKKDRRINTVLSVLFTILCIAWLYPVFMILMNSLKTERAITTSHAFELPNAETFVGLKNYIYGIQEMDFLSSFWYSLVITVSSVALILLCCSMCAWYITRVQNTLSKGMYYLCVFSMIVPFQMVMFTLAKTADTLKLNNPYNICIIYLGFGAGLAVFMFTGFVKSIPLEIDEAAMIEALKSGEIAGAGLDVFEQEPPADDNPLFSMENVIVSPHNAALSDGALRAMAMDSAQGITEYLTGKPVTYPVNKEVLK